MLSCAISGEVPKVPVVSIKSGHIFEERLILKAINEDGKCPVTDQELTPNDLVQVINHKPVQPRPPSATSISSLLRTFQDEWDGLLLSSYKSNRHVSEVRQQLSHALYQHDAACRVIARLTGERDKAREELAKKIQKTERKRETTEDAMEVDTKGLDDDVVQQIASKQAELRAWRKNRSNRKKSPTSMDVIAKFEATYSTALHSPSESGILCMALNPRNPNTIFTGGVDSTVLLWNKEQETQEALLRGHDKRILVLKAHAERNLLLSGSADKTIGIWNQNEEDSSWNLQFRPNFHNGSVNDLSLHPVSEYYVSCSTDGTWAFNNLVTGQTLNQTNCGMNVGCSQFHPDGHLMGTGLDSGVVEVWDLMKHSKLVTLPFSNASVTSMCFSQNGYHLAYSDASGDVRVIDLRKGTVLHTFDSPGSAVHKVQYDSSGQYLACAGSDIRVYKTKQWSTIATWSGHTKDVMDVAWGPHASYLASVSKDRTLKIWSVS